MILSICIATLKERESTLNILLDYLRAQIHAAGLQYVVEVLVESDNRESPTGTKRNKLYRAAKGKYVCSVDDDDWIDKDYVKEIVKAVETDPDCVGLCGMMYTDSGNPQGWAISLFNPYHTIRKAGRPFHLRYPNHLAPIRTSIAIQFPFPDITYGEDHAFATAIHDANALKTEVIIFKNLYEYRYNSKK